MGGVPSNTEFGVKWIELGLTLRIFVSKCSLVDILAIVFLIDMRGEKKRTSITNTNWFLLIRSKRLKETLLYTHLYLVYTYKRCKCSIDEEKKPSFHFFTLFECA